METMSLRVVCAAVVAAFMSVGPIGADSMAGPATTISTTWLLANVALMSNDDETKPVICEAPGERRRLFCVDWGQIPSGPPSDDNGGGPGDEGPPPPDKNEDDCTYTYEDYVGYVCKS